MPGWDRISELPESLKTQILLYLPTKDAVKTSVLSTSWKNLWLNVPGLDLNCHDFPSEDCQVFIDFIDRFLQFNPDSRLNKFKVDYGKEEEYSRFKDWIGTAVNRGIQHLDLVTNRYFRDDDDNGNIYPCIKSMPRNLYTSNTLVSLKISFSGLKDTGFVSMPCLKFMDLKEIHWRDPMNLEKLISGCPVLEQLTLVREKRCGLAVTGLSSQSLKRFCVPPEYDSSIFWGYTLEIDAPRLEYMSLKKDHFDRIVVKNLTSLFTVDLDIQYSRLEKMLYDPEIDKIDNFLTGLSSVRHMIISQRILKTLHFYTVLEPIPKFDNLSRLQIAFPILYLRFLPTFLESCPNLKHLILNFVYTWEEAFGRIVTTVPRCLLSSLECVEIKKVRKLEKYAIKVVSYFLENSSVLKKLSLSFIGNPLTDPESNIYQELDKLTKRSPRCQIICE